MDPIPLFDLALREQDIAAAVAVLRTGELRAGAVTAAFEAAFAARLGCGHAVALGSGTAALHRAYLAVGVGPGDEVIVPSFTFVATAAAVRYCGATPVFADVVGPERPVIDPAHVATLITPRTRAITCVHYAGYAAPAHELRALCEAHGLALVEDAAHAPAASAGGTPLGTIGHVGCFSLFSNKVLSVGEGGVLCTDDADVAATARRTDLDVGGRFDEQRAALAHSRLSGLEADVTARRALTRRYRALLDGVDGVQAPFPDAAVAESSCYVMPVMLADPERQAPVRRGLRERHGVQTSLLYPALHELTAYRDGSGRLPQTERCARTQVTLPLYPHLTPAQQDRVVDALAEELARA